MNSKRQKEYDTLVEMFEGNKESPVGEAEVFAGMYLEARTPNAREEIIEMTLRRGGNWDSITRSTCFFNIFEMVVGRDFYQFWANNEEEYLEAKKAVEDMEND